MLKLKQIIRTAVFASVATAIVVLFNPNFLHAETLDEVRTLIFKAEDGDGDALEEIIEILEKLQIEQPENAKVIAFLGSAYGLSADHTWNPLKKGELANQGIRYLDIALDMAPNDFEVRLNRAKVNLAVPFFMGRKDEGIEDLVVLDKLFRENPTPMLAREMIAFYDVLSEDAPDRGDWAEGKALAEKHAK